MQVGLGGDVNQRIDEGMTPLHMASVKGFANVVRYRYMCIIKQGQLLLLMTMTMKIIVNNAL